MGRPNSYKYRGLKQENSKLDDPKLTELKGKTGKSTIRIRDFYISGFITGRRNGQKNQ